MGRKVSYSLAEACVLGIQGPKGLGLFGLSKPAKQTRDGEYTTFVVQVKQYRAFWQMQASSNFKVSPEVPQQGLGPKIAR